MDESTKVKAIVVKSEAYKEHDRIVTLFSLEFGMIKAVLKSVEKQQSKLKFAKEPFCFAEFCLNKSAFLPVVTGAEIIDSFYEITSDYEKYVDAFEIIKIITSYMKPNQAEPNLFLLFIKVLRAFAYDKTKSKILVLKFMLSFLQLSGYKLNFTNCSNCRSKFVKKAYVDLSNCCFVCFLCQSSNVLEVDVSVLNAMRLLFNCELDKLCSLEIEQNILLESIKICGTMINNL